MSLSFFCRVDTSRADGTRVVSRFLCSGIDFGVMRQNRAYDPGIRKEDEFIALAYPPIFKMLNWRPTQEKEVSLSFFYRVVMNRDFSTRIVFRFFCVTLANRYLVPTISAEGISGMMDRIEQNRK